MFNLPTILVVVALVIGLVFFIAYKMERRSLGPVKDAAKASKRRYLPVIYLAIVLITIFVFPYIAGHRIAEVGINGFNNELGVLAAISGTLLFVVIVVLRQKRK